MTPLFKDGRLNNRNRFTGLSEYMKYLLCDAPKSSFILTEDLTTEEQDDDYRQDYHTLMVHAAKDEDAFVCSFTYIHTVSVDFNLDKTYHIFVNEDRDKGIDILRLNGQPMNELEYDSFTKVLREIFKIDFNDYLIGGKK